EYKTASGRKVLSGGGVEPDVDVEAEIVSQLAITLYVKNYLFDYATIYARKNNTIAPPEQFALSNDEFNEFSKWLDSKDYSYKTETEITLDSLKSAAKRDKYFADIESTYNTLESKLKHDKKQDLARHRAEVSELLESEIISRYYYMRGRIAHGMRNDKDVAKALSLLEKPSGYM